MQPQQIDDTPDPGGRGHAVGRAGRPSRAAKVLLVAVCVLLTAPFLAVGYRAWYSAFPWERSPERIRWCWRDFQRSGVTRTRAQVDAEQVALPGDAPYPTSTVGRWPAPGWFGSGRPLLAHVTPKTRQDRLGVPCTMGLYLQTGPDAYAAYTLVGGP